LLLRQFEQNQVQTLITSYNDDIQYAVAPEINFATCLKAGNLQLPLGAIIKPENTGVAISEQ
jgi:hypothetical protein